MNRIAINPIWQTLASQEWAAVVKALLHTLWIGAACAVAVYFILRKLSSPRVRYATCVAALLVVVFGGVVAWALSGNNPTVVHRQIVVGGTAVTERTSSDLLQPTVQTATAAPPPTVTRMIPVGWTPWVALVWLGGAAVMLLRSGWLVAKAGSVRRQSRPLVDEAVERLFEEAREKLGVARRIQVRVTEELTSPAVMGWVTPVLILPLSMLTTLPMAQIQLILLHELAHIRRGDYLVNLGQLVAESLLFFNPAVWWISRQIRQEREACCDAAAIAVAGERLQYARTLAEVAGSVLAAAPAFGDQQNPSSLKDRIQRLLVPGYRPAVRVTWGALLAAFVAGGGLLFLSALGTRAAVQAILSPQERAQQIEKKITAMGIVEPGERKELPMVSVAGHIWMADGTPVPTWISMALTSINGGGSVMMAIQAHNGAFSNTIMAGNISVVAEITNFAPAMIGALNGKVTNHFDNLLLTIDRGFDAKIQVVEEVSDKPVAEAKLSAAFGVSGTSRRELTTDAYGIAMMANAADIPLNVWVNAPGYAIVQQKFDSVPKNAPLRIVLQPGGKVSGVALDKVTGKPIAGATVRERYEEGGPTEQGFPWNDAIHVLTTTDQNGRFETSQLRPNGTYSIGVSAAGHASVTLNRIHAGATLEAKLGPELIVKGRVTGDLSLLPEVGVYEGGKYIRSDKVIHYGIADEFGGGHNTRNENQGQVAVRIVEETNHFKDTNADRGFIYEGDWVKKVGYFEFTNEEAGPVRMEMQYCREEREVVAQIDDWEIDLSATPKKDVASVGPKREVIFRFKDASGATPHGRVAVTIPDSMVANHLTAHSQEMDLTNGEARAEIQIGGQTMVEAKHLVGYWFNQWKIGKNGASWIIVTNGTGPIVVDVPLLPAGAIYVKARTVDGKPATDVLFGVEEIKKAPSQGGFELNMQENGSTDGSPRQWAATPLPLGRTYAIYGWQGNSFFLSKEVTLTEANPDAEVELQCRPGKTYEGVFLDPDGKPLQDAEVSTEFSLKGGHDFGLKSSFTDAQGKFRIEGMTPELGNYTIYVKVPGIEAEIVSLKFGSQPQTIQAKRGFNLAGRVVDAETGQPIADTDVRAYDSGHPGVQPMMSARSDANGRFEFKSLGDEMYSFYCSDGQVQQNFKAKADGSTNVVVPVKLYEWSKAKKVVGTP
jgi:beta-lactamase regulating signal transducer with metallopeptidase domain/uncharacterized GH25 family protein